MRRILFILLIIISFQKGNAQPLPPNNPNYEIVFNEEFDGSTINENIWKNTPNWNQQGYEFTNCGNLPNGFLASSAYGYRKRDFSNCEVASGKLRIISKNESYMGLVYNWYNCNSDSCEGLSCNNNICFKQDNWNFNYTTNRLWSYEKFRFGYFEIRCQIIKPTAPKTNKGIGPNFWLWSKKDEISISELDVFEFNGQNSTFCPNIHYRLNDSAPYYHWSPGLNIYVNFNTAHTFAAHWLPQKLNILLDNSLVASTTVNTANLQAMPMIVDVNVPASNYCQFIDATTQFPHNYDVYWVKVYQLKNRCTLDNQICSLASALYGQFRNIQIGGDGCSISVSSGQNIHLVATNSITIDKNVTIGLGATFVAETFPEVVSEHDIPLKSANIPSPPPAGFYNRHY